MDKLNDYGRLIRYFLQQHYNSLQNEFQIQRVIFEEKKIKKVLVEWVEENKVDISNKSTAKSDEHREAGNRLFRANKKQNALKASECYTYAIIAAPKGSKSLALAYANRSASISEFGYYKVAYEDCVCAIENGYPAENMEKIIARQAFCANKLGDYDKLKACIDKLNTMTLSKPYERQKATFEEDLLKLHPDKESRAEALSTDSYIQQEISHHPEKGRCLKATKDIEKGEVILTEKAFALVPLENMRICRNCAAQNIIPFPCDICSNVFYCSLECKTAHETIHQYECYAYKSQIIWNIGLVHLAMCTLLKGLPSILDSLKDCKSGEKVWECIEKISRSGGKGYPEILSLVTNLKSTQNTQTFVFEVHCSGAAVITIYLMEYTTFFDLFKDTKCSKQEWTVVISGLLLRHILQMVYNASTSLYIYPIAIDIVFPCLSDIWEKPHHLKRGHLHKFRYVRPSYAAIFPHLSICNHSCEPSFHLRFDRDRVAAYARDQLRQGSEIHNAYMGDFKQNSKTTRKALLKEHFNFDCRCTRCASDYRDEVYLQFYRYRCQKSTCKTVFVTQLENQDWWFKDEELSFLTCPACKEKLKLNWYWEFDSLTYELRELTEALKILKFSEKCLVGHNALRRFMCENVTDMLFSARKHGIEVNNYEFAAVGDAVKYLLEVNEQRNDFKTLPYIAHAAYALDLMALGKYYNFDCSKIRMGMDMLSGEMRSIFDNYIEDYIGKRFYADGSK